LTPPQSVRTCDRRQLNNPEECQADRSSG
jgi:hypothetical protein